MILHASSFMIAKQCVASAIVFSSILGISLTSSEAATIYFGKPNIAGQHSTTVAQGVPQNLPTVAPGDRGQAVLVLQRSLKDLGYYSGLLDGVYEDGFILAQSVRRFQADHGLPVDGIVGPATWNAIQGQLNRR